MKNNRILDGAILIALGLFLLALNQGWIPAEIAGSLVRNFWPVLLIVLGLLVIIRGGISFIVVLALIFSLLGIGIFGQAWRWFGMDFRGMPAPGRMPMGRAETAVFSEELNGATDLTLSLAFGAGSLSIEGGSDRLAEASLDYGTVRPSWEVSRDGARATIKANQGNGERFPIGQGGLNWRLKLNSAVNLDLTTSMGAGKVELDLKKTKLKRLNISAGAGDLEVSFPEEPQMTARISGGATNLQIMVPQSVGVSVRASNPIIAGSLEREGLTKAGDVYVSKDFATAKAKLEIDLSAGVGNVKIRR